MIRRLVVWVREHPNPVAVWGVVLVSFLVLAGMSYVIREVRGTASKSERLGIENRRLGLENRRLARSNRQLGLKAAALAKQGDEAHDALCVFKADLAARTAASLAFLADPPREIFGIKVTPALIAQAQTSATNQQATLDSLSGLDCATKEDT